MTCDFLIKSFISYRIKLRFTDIHSKKMSVIKNFGLTLTCSINFYKPIYIEKIHVFTMNFDVPV